MPVDEVEIIPINLLPDAPAITLTTNVPMGIDGDDSSYKGTILDIANVVSEQIGTVTVPDPFFYRVDGVATYDPPAGQANTPDPDLEGLDYNLFKWGAGPLRKGIDWQNDIAGGGWRLIGETMTAGETYIAFPKPEVSNILATPNAIGRFVSGVQDITSNGIIPAIYYRNLLNIKGATDITLPLCSEYPVNVLLSISTSDGPQKQTTINAQGADVIDNNTTGITAVILGNREFLQLVTDGSKWYIVGVSPAAFKDPWQEFGWFDLDNLGLNQLPLLGGVFARADYPRVVRFINKLKSVNPLLVKNAADWPANRTFWGDGNGTTTFQCPDIGGYFPRALDGPSGTPVDPDRGANKTIPSSLQNMEIQSHDHDVFLGDVAGRSDNANDRDVMIPGTRNNKTGLTGGAETRPVNVGFFPIINV